MADLKICDNEYREIAELYKEIGNTLDSQINKYIEYLNRVCENAVKSGNVYENLMAFTAEAGMLKGQLNNITAIIKEEVINYIESVDNTDEYLF